MIKVVGLGPGEPSLVTVKGVETLRAAKKVYVPVSSRSERSLAERIVKKYTSAEIDVVEIPMGTADVNVWRGIASKLRDDVALAVLGDPALYSTAAKLLPYLESPVEFIPGVSSITACALYAGRILATGNESIAVVPAGRQDLLSVAVELFDVVVIIKANRNLDLMNQLLKRYGGIAVRRCHMEGATVAGEVTWQDYFTTAYIWRGR